MLPWIARNVNPNPEGLERRQTVAPVPASREKVEWRTLCRVIQERR